MENYGFVLMNREEATQFGFPNGGTGMFEGLYYDMMAEVSRDPTNKYGTAPEMTDDEKFISFLNRYFIFRKVRHVAAEKITKLIESKIPSKDASKCAAASALVAPVVYGSPDSVDSSVGIQPLSSVGIPKDSSVGIPKDSSVDARVLEEGEEPDDEGISKIAKDFNKRQELAEREAVATKDKSKDQKPTEREELLAKLKPADKEQEPKEKSHFIRPIGNVKMTIRVYEPAEGSNKPVEITNLPIEEGPAIQLVPKNIRIGKTVKMTIPRK
jgi:hypothetical protein